jgi:hypothetical protein
MWKAAHIVVAEVLAEVAVRSRQQSDSQYGIGKRRSVFDALVFLVDRVQAAWRERHTDSILLMDIKAAFQSIGKGTDIHTMGGQRLDRDLM